MATKKNKKENKIGKTKAIVKKINSDLIDASFDAIEATVKTGEKWQKLTAKMLKKAEPLTKKQVNMVVSSATSIMDQVESGTERLKNLVGYDAEMIEKTKKKLSDSVIVKKAEKMKDKIEKEITENPLVQKAEEMKNKLQKEVIETISEVRDTVEHYTEEKNDKVVKAAKAAKKKAKTVKEEANTAVKETKTAAKNIAKETKEATKTVAKGARKEAAKVKKAVAKVSENDNLKVIKGIGPKLESVLNEKGIKKYADILDLSENDLEKILEEANVKVKSFNVSDWKIQAKMAASGDLEGVANWIKASKSVK